jgi:uncharacterized protein YbjT (DUF2867 family)
LGAATKLLEKQSYVHGEERMSDAIKTVLVTAGNGNQARAVIPPLARAGMRVRAMRRSDRPGPGPKDLGAAEVFVGDAADPSDASRAMEGVQAVYHVGRTFHPRERDMAINMIDRAERAGVEHFVFSSVLHPILFGLPQHAIKREIEEYLLQSKLNFTILQPSDYMQMTVLSVMPDQGLLMMAYENDNREALVDLDDVAEVLVKVLQEGAVHYGATYELSDGHNPRKADLVAGLTEAFGRPFSLMKYPASFEHRPEIFGDVDEAHARHQMTTLRAVHAWYDRYDFIGNGNVLAMLLGRQPTTWVQFLRRHFRLSD